MVNPEYDYGQLCRLVGHSRRIPRLNGRPAKLNSPLHRLGVLYNCRAAGLSDATACALVGITVKTLQNWKNSNSEIARFLDSALPGTLSNLAHKLIELAENSTSEKIQLDAIRFMLTRKSDEFADRLPGQSRFDDEGDVQEPDPTFL